MHRLIYLLFPALAGLTLVLIGVDANAAPALPLATVTGADGDTDSYSISIQILVLMTILTLLPSIIIMLTAFTRIIVVFAILRQALGLQQTPSNQILIGLALFLTAFVMMPVLQRINEVAVQPYLAETLGPEAAMQAA